MQITSNIASIYIVVITIAWVVIFYAFLRQRKLLRKNKCNYDLKDIRFEIEPVGNDTWRLNFFYGDHVLHSEIVSEVDIMNDRGYFFKAFVKWAEEYEDD